MKQNPLGRTAASVSALGIGDIADRAVPLDRCVATIHRAMDHGWNVIDTAPNYEEGYSEQIVGAALRGRRDGMFVIDKIDHLDAPVTPQVEASLAALGMDHVDLLAFHSVSSLADWRRVSEVGFPELLACRDAGKTRFVGLSSHHPAVLAAALESGLCDVLMFPVGPFVDRRYIDEILPEARRRGVGSVCFKTFGAGKLLGDTSGYNQPLEARPRGKFSSGGHDRPGEPVRPRLTVEECLHYTLTVGPDVALLGLSFPNEQDAAFAACASFRPLDPSALRAIEERAVTAVAGKGRCW